MNSPGDPTPVYIDQNILSHLREGKSAKDELVGVLSKLQERNVIFVFSMTHVDECRASSQPEQFVEVMEELPVYLMEFENAIINPPCHWGGHGSCCWNRRTRPITQNG